MKFSIKYEWEHHNDRTSFQNCIVNVRLVVKTIIPVNFICAQAHFCISFSVKWVPWSETMLFGILWWWIRHSLSPQIIVWATVLCLEKTNLYTEWVSILLRTKCCHFDDGSNQCNQPATRSQPITPENGAISGAQCWFLLLADCAPSIGHNQVGLIEWKFILLSSCITFLFATMATFSWAHWTITEVAGKRGWLEGESRMSRRLKQTKRANNNVS